MKNTAFEEKNAVFFFFFTNSVPGGCTTFAEKDTTMKHFLHAALTGLLLFTLTACEDFLSSPSVRKTGSLSWRFIPLTKAGDFPDTNRFLLKVTDASGKAVFDGLYGDSPEALDVPEGNYTVSVRSREFVTPAFDAPLWGDTQVVPVRKGRTSRVLLECTMLNSGIRLRLSPAFRKDYPEGALEISSIDGKLPWADGETGTAYFHPGIVTLLLQAGQNSKALFSRDLEPREILTVTLAGTGSVAGETGADVSIAVDTSRVWHETTVGADDPAAGSSKEKALSVSQARATAGASGIWVHGYIVGGDLSSTGNKMATGPEFTKDTHLALAARSSVTDKSVCLSVELPKGTVRDAINLKDHPDLLGRHIYLKGTLVGSYFGIPGLKGVSDFSLE